MRVPVVAAIVLAAALQPPVRAADDDSCWSGAFALPGTSGPVHAMLQYNDGLVIAGGFANANGRYVNGAVFWDADGWHKMGTGPGQGVRAFLEYGGHLYGGSVRWDGTQWTVIGPTPVTVAGLAVFQGELVAGGSFTSVPGTPANYIARWNGTTWHPLGLGLNGFVRALAVYQGSLYVAGAFTTAGGVPAQGIARWDGSAWHAVGSGLGGEGVCLTIFESKLVVGGSFTTAGGVAAPRVARWDGATWSALGQNFPGTPYEFWIDGGSLIAGGAFPISRWNGSVWAPMVSSPMNVRCFAEMNGQLILGGSFTSPADHLAARDGNSWVAVPVGGLPSTQVLALAVHDQEIVTSYSDPQNLGRIASWNGQRWLPLGDAAALTLQEYQGHLVAGGNFVRIGGNDALRIATWNGSAWGPVGLGFDAAVYATTTWGGDLIAGGAFTQSGNGPALHVARWDGSGWSALGDGFDNSVYALAVIRDTLIAGGEFTHSGTTSVAHVAFWSGSDWKPLGDGLDGRCNALTVFEGRLVAGGSIHNSDVTPTGLGVAAWDGARWRALGSGQSRIYPVHSLWSHASGLYVGGYNVDDSAILQWNGADWVDLGSGIGGSFVYAMTEYAEGLFVGGVFTDSGNKAAWNFARWQLGRVAVAIDDFELLAAPGEIQLNWRIASTGGDQIASVVVDRSGAEEGPYTDISGRLEPATSMRFSDTRIEPGQSYWYRIRAVQRDGREFVSAPITVQVSGGLRHTALQAAFQRADRQVVIRYTLGAPTTLFTLSILDVHGRVVRHVATGSGHAGDHVRTWNGYDSTNRRVARGVYIVVLSTADVLVSRKLLVVAK